jgi:beta-alanine--pyruvate transaminase
VDLRNLGLMAALELDPRPGAPGSRGFELFLDCFQHGALVRATGDVIAFSPPLVIERAQIEQLFATVAEGLRRLA